MKNTTVSKPISWILNQINNGQERSVKAKKNIITGFAIKGCSILINLILVPLTITYVDTSRYGIWLALSSIVGWISFFDIGLTGGLRNKFAQALAKDDHESAQIYVSTTYAILAIIFFGVWLIFLVANQFLDWTYILNVPVDMERDVALLAVIIVSYFCLLFVLKIVSTVLIADQQPAQSSLIDLVGQVMAFFIILILVNTTKGSLINLGLGLCLAPCVVLLAANLLLFNGKYRRYRPSISSVKLVYAKDLFSLGVVFFVIQIAYMIQYESANFIIAHNFKFTDVTAYNIVYKYFFILSMLFGIFLAPLWSASTEAFLKNDLTWLRNSVKKYSVINLGLFLLSIVMLLFSQQVFDLWLGKGTVEIDFALTFWGFVFFNIGMFGSKYSSILNGISALKLQFWSSLISPFLYIAVTLVLINYFKMGVAAVFVGAAISNFYAFLVSPVQYYHIIVKKSANKIWYK